MFRSRRVRGRVVGSATRTAVRCRHELLPHGPRGTGRRCRPDHLDTARTTSLDPARRGLSMIGRSEGRRQIRGERVNWDGNLRPQRLKSSRSLSVSARDSTVRPIRGRASLEDISPRPRTGPATRFGPMAFHGIAGREKKRSRRREDRDRHQDERQQADQGAICPISEPTSAWRRGHGAPRVLA